MPRALSLKKVPSKNQTTITAFLKCAPGTSSCTQNIAIKNNNTRCNMTKSAKRKILSDALVEDPTSADLQNVPSTKRTKIGITYKSSPLLGERNSPKKTSPNKEIFLDEVFCSERRDLAEPHNAIQLGDRDSVDNFINLSEQYIKNKSPVEVNKNHVQTAFDIRRRSQKLLNHVTISAIKVSSSKGGGLYSQKNQKGFSECSPSKESSLLDKGVKDIISPSKCGSTVKILDVNIEDINDVFENEWGDDKMREVIIEDLDLSKIQRCEILSVKLSSNRIELRLENCEKKRATCFIEGTWLHTPLIPGDIISVLASRDTAGQYCINNTSGLLVLRPDHLTSSTSVVAAVFCKRKAILQERWRGIDSANMAMTIGILIHELVQKALTMKITSIEQLGTITDNIIKESVKMIYDAGISEEDAKSHVHKYIPPLADFMNEYVVEKPPVSVPVLKDKYNWTGHIDEVLDIEENLCCPELGLKGKIDATVQVTIHDKKGRQSAVVPLELKSGKASMSAEHRGQLVLYGMMLNIQNREDPILTAQRGLLLYLKDRVELREVSCGYPERRDLIMLRNELVQHLFTSPQAIDQDKLTDIEDASALLQQRLPEPVEHPNACAKCPYLTLCSIHLWHTDGPNVSETHPLSKLRSEALGHLSQEHIKYFLQWSALLNMEDTGQKAASPLHALWTENVLTREKRGTCAGNLKLKSVQSMGDRNLHIFQRPCSNEGKAKNKVMNGPQEGDFSIVSIDNRPWIAAGIVTVSNAIEIHILLERDLSRRLNADMAYHIDNYESYATTVQNLTNLGVLMEDSDRAERLRRLIINKDPPHFEAKLPREVGRLGTKLMRSLNIQQQRAVLKALSARDYTLLQGLPGTGKTQTISVLIQMLVSLKQRVLVTAHTHSAVDTVLCRIPDTVRVMRLGSSSRVAAALLKRTEQTLTVDCDTTHKLEKVYESMEVVGVTCLGAAHAMLTRTIFDVCIVDEATQVLQCTVLRPLFAAKRFVLVGDPEQLPPVVRSRAARRLGMEESLFHKLMCEEATSTLQLQYRMNQPITDVANLVAYNGKLKCANQDIAQATLSIDMHKICHITSESTWLATACSPEQKHAVLFIDVDNDGDVANVSKDSKNSYTNSTEACVVLALVETLKEGNVKSSDIGIIAPYRDQVSLLRRAMSQHGVEVSTVDQFQGRDKPVILFSCTKSAVHDTHKIKEGEVLSDQRRLAVSVTRAKYKLLIIGNSTALQQYIPLQRLITNCNSINLEITTLANIRQKYQTYV